MSPLRNLSIRAKLIILLVGACVAVLVSACGAFVAYDRMSYGEAKGKTLGVLTDAVAMTLAGPVAFQDDGSATTVLGNLNAEPTALAAAVYTKDEARLSEWHRDAVEALSATRSGQVAHAEDGALVIERPIGPADAPVGSLVVVYSTADVQARLVQFLKIAGVVLLLSIALAFTLALSTHSIISDPIKRLAAAARTVQRDGDYTVRADVDQGDELGLLARAFNTMLEDIQARDTELKAHRDHLEGLVGERTRHLDERNAAMRLVLDNIDQAIVTMGRDGVLQAERSRAYEQFFGIPAAGATLAAHLGDAAPGFEDWFLLGWESVTDGWLPLELCIDQLPGTVVAGERHFTLSYKPILENDELKDVLVVITDVTADVEREANEARQREFIAIFEAMNKDRAGFEDFLREADALVASLVEPGAFDDLPLFKRRLHTLKGNAAIYGLGTIAGLCHTVEDGMETTGEAPTAEDLAPIVSAWEALRARIDAVAGTGAGDERVGPDALEALRQAVLSGESRERLAAHIGRLAMDPVGPRLAALAARAEATAAKLGKSVAVAVDDGGLRLPREPWAGLWNALVHVVRNAVDHGVETAETRGALGKPAAGALALTAGVVATVSVQAPAAGGVRCGALEASGPSCLAISIADDGAGVDWAALAGLADRQGIVADDRAQLAALMFSDGVTTRATASETSGRGVGTAAVLGEVIARGGCIDVHSTPGAGTTFRFLLPLDRALVPVPLTACA